MPPLRLIFMGTPEFAVPTLEALIAAGHAIVCVYTQPPRPAGRGQRAAVSPVQAAAAAHGLAVRTPLTLKDPDAQAALTALTADLAVVVAYGLILPPAVLAAPRLGCLNLHASLLPRWRGAAPIQRAVMAGDSETGVAVMVMEAGLDTGPVLLEERVPIGPASTAAELHDDLARRGAALMVAALDGLAEGRLLPRPQPAEGVTYAAKISKAETHIDWQRPAVEIDRQIRALTPLPGAWFEHRGERIKVHAARPVVAAGTPGTVLDNRPVVACGVGGLELLSLQRQGRGAMSAADLLRGFPLPPGTVLG